MANSWGPFGLIPSRLQNGSVPTYGTEVRNIASTDTSLIGFGDVVVSLSTGVITLAAAGTSFFAGVMQGCTYVSVSQQKTVWNRWYPGSDGVSGTITAYIANSPNQVYRGQVGASGSGPVALTNVGNNINFAVGSGANTITGMSQAYLDYSTISTLSTRPFRILPLLGDIAIDNTTANNTIEVCSNNNDFNQQLGI